jgi:hypothetical protein
MEAALGDDFIGRTLCVLPRLRAGRMAMHDEIAIASLDLNFFAVGQPGRAGDIHGHTDGEIFAPFADD